MLRSVNGCAPCVALWVGLTMLCPVSLPLCSAEPEQLLISSIGSERATSGAGGKIATFQGKTHVVWQDATEEGYFNRVCTYDHSSGGLTERITLNQGRDNHARPVIAIGPKGYLHVVLSGHNSPVTYRRSVQPNDSSAWTEPEAAGSGTYPTLVCGADGTLYLTLRSSKRWNGVDLYVKPPDQPWRKQCKLVVRDPNLNGYAGFLNGLAWGPDHQTLHLVQDFYESKGSQRGVHQAVCYMQSRDGGRTWQRADGTPVALPARPEQMDILARSIGERHQPKPPPICLAQGSVVVDGQNRPHILYVSHIDAPGQAVYATLNERGDWQQEPIDELTQEYPEYRPIACRGSLAIDSGGVVYALLELVPVGKGWVDGKPSRNMKFDVSGKKLVWVVTRDEGNSFSVSPALADGLVFNQANVERPSGFNHMPEGRKPLFIYFDGTSRYPEKNEILQNHVYLVKPSKVASRSSK